MKKLQECTTLQEAQPFLRGKSPTFRKTVETAILLRQHPDPSQRALGDGFMATAIQEMDADEQPTPHHDDGVKPKGEHFVKEELLAGGDKDGNEGSEQSSKNSGPLPKEGTEEPVGDLEEPEMKTENQMTETFPGMMPGLDPQLAQQMAPAMGKMPPLTTPQQIQQMQYTVKKYMEAYVQPLRKQVVQLTKANTFLSNKVKEIQSNSLIGMDLHEIKDKKYPHIQETMPQSVSNISPDKTGPRIFEKAYNLEREKRNILELDKMIANSGNRTPYQ